jgi:hypothetical protein
MGLARLSRELKKARGTLSQKAAATHWGVPYTTLCALEQGKPRNYQPHTLAHFDAMLGRSAWDLYDMSDEAGYDVPAASVAALDELRARVDELADQLHELAARTPNPLEALAVELTAAELDEVIAFAHFLLGRRR